MILWRHAICIETTTIKPSHCFPTVKLENNECNYSITIHTSTLRIYSDDFLCHDVKTGERKTHKVKKPFNY